MRRALLVGSSLFACALAASAILIACGDSTTDQAADGGAAQTGDDGSVTTTVGDASSDAIATLADGGKAPVACTATRVTYGDAWIRGASHPADFDDATGLVTWDGTCTDDGANSF
ncbi:MAG: hypothetical protein ABI461_16485, partial [Polyangiaceae bacterium]